MLDQFTERKTDAKVYCISDADQFELDDFVRWAIDTLPLEFKESGIRPKDKKKHFRDDHGKDILNKFADKILKEPYIVEVVNSLPFNPKAKDMIKEVTDEGLIKLVLVDTDKRLGMVIRTTAATRREALYHVADIRKKYR